MNWIKFDIKNEKTYPSEHTELKIFNLVNRYILSHSLDSLVVENDEIQAWAYIMPPDMQDIHIDDYISRGRHFSVCKPMSFKEIDDKPHCMITPKEFAYLLSRLHVYEVDKLIAGSSLCSDFHEDIDHIESDFILKNNDGNFYLVDTQGYGYCRYVSRLEIQKEG